MKTETSSRAKRRGAAPRAGSKREANKIDKLNRVKRAARDLFTTIGYDEATTRQIAARADVALGTVFTYATTKRDLLFLVSNDLLDETRDRAEASFRPERSLQMNFMVFCGLFYKVLSEQVELSKLVLRELLFYDSGIHAERAKENRAQTLNAIAAMVASAHAKGEIRLPESPDFIAWVLFSIFQAENRRWLGPEQRSMVEGLTHLWRSVALLLNGISVAGVPMQPAKGVIRKLVASL